MAKELYLYSTIYDFVAKDLISSMEENKSEDITLRANSPGGSVFAGWGIIGKMKEHEGKITVKVDGYVASMATFILIYASDSEALDVSRVMIHRADMYVSSPEDQAFLNSVNKDLKSKLASKIDADKLKELKGVTLDDIFNPETRIDVWLSAKEAKAIGLISKINKVNPQEARALNERLFNMAAELKHVDNQGSKKMEDNKITTLEELKAKYPAIYAAALAEGIAKEKDRVGAWMTFAKIDLESVITGVKEGKDLSATAMAEFTLKSISAKSLEKIGAESATTVTTPEPAKQKTEKEKEIEAFEKEMSALLNLKTA